MKNKRRVLVLVDGYNLYHGLCDMQGTSLVIGITPSGLTLKS
jgi:hypothetical protein